PSSVRETTARIVGKAVRDWLGLKQRRLGPKVPTRVGNTGHAVKDTRASADSSFSIAKYVPGKAESRLKIRFAQRIKTCRYASEKRVDSWIAGGRYTAFGGIREAAAR